MPFDDVLGYVSAVSGVLGSVCWVAYKVFVKRSDSIRTAKHIPIEELKSTFVAQPGSAPSTGQYVALEGEIKVENPILTQYTTPKDQAAAYYWLNTTNKDAKLFLGKELYTTTSQQASQKSAPFYLTSGSGPTESKVLLPDIKPAVSDQLHFPLDALDQVSKAHYESKFTPDEVLYHVSRGTIPKGVTFTERVLPAGSRLTAIGHVVQDKDGNFSFTSSPMSDQFEHQPFIVSRSPYQTVLGAENHRAKTYKWATAGFLTVAGLGATYLVGKYLYRAYGKYQEYQRMLEFKELQRRRRRQKEKKREKAKRDKEKRRQQKERERDRRLQLRDRDEKDAMRFVDIVKPNGQRLNADQSNSNTGSGNASGNNSSSAAPGSSSSGSNNNASGTGERKLQVGTSSASSNSQQGHRRGGSQETQQQQQQQTSRQGRGSLSRTQQQETKAPTPSNARPSSLEEMVDAASPARPSDRDQSGATSQHAGISASADLGLLLAGSGNVGNNANAQAANLNNNNNNGEQGSDAGDLSDQRSEADSVSEDVSDAGSDMKEDSAALCVICSEGKANAALLECGHMFTCMACAQKLTKCPICREKIVKVQRVYTN